MNNESRDPSQGGGVSISGGSVTVVGDIVGRDKVVGVQLSRIELDQTFRPVEEAIRVAPSPNQSEAMRKLEELKTETAKGKGAKDAVVAKLVDGLTGLIPSAVGAVASAFGAPLLGGIAGPATKYVLDKIQGK